MGTNAEQGPENANDKKSASEQKRIILEKIRTEASHRPLVPFLGAGVSLSAGFPTIKFVIHYLAKVDFAIRLGVFEGRFPVIRESQQSATETYRQHPSKYLEDFGWPNLGQLNADIWDWLERGHSKPKDDPYKGEGRQIVFEYCQKKIGQYKNERGKYEEHKKNTPAENPKPRLPPLPDLLDNDITIPELPYTKEDDPAILTLRKGQEPLDLRDHQLAIVQWILRKELAERESGTTHPLLYRWLKWKDCYFNENKDDEDPELLYGDWEVLLDRLCEGNFNLVDALFTSFEQGLNPTISHRFLAFLKPKLGIPLILTTNFDSLLERAFQNEGILPKVFDIHRDAELPNPMLVRQQFSLIKLHGSAYGIRHGERLKYKLETDAQNNTIGYLPKDAIILVMGFNGSERRIMQMLQAIVGEGKLEKEKVRLIWIQGPSKPGPLFDELLATSNGTVLRCDAGHADTFLQELYFLMSRNAYQSSAKNYLTMPDRPLMMELKDFTLESNSVADTREKKEKKRRPIHLCVGNIEEGQPSSSWPSLAAMAFTNQLLGYTVIWINLESHHTVEGIIAEFFERVRVLDPQAPSCVITNMDKYGDEAIEKTVDRISDVFKRGRYVLVLDEVESFGRPQMVHHGMTQSENPNNIRQLENLKKFLFALLHINVVDTIEQHSRFYWDSYVVVTADNLRFRHQPLIDNTGTNETGAYRIIENILDELKKVTEDYPHIKVHSRKSNDYSDLLKQEIIPETPVLTEKLNTCWVYNKQYKPFESTGPKRKNYDTSKERTKGVIALLVALRAERTSDKPSEEIIFKKDAIEAFICLLSVFRRPRSLPLIHSIIDRWALRKIGETPLNEGQSEAAHKAITDLLLTISLNNDKNPVGVVSQNHEGGTVWLYREVYEATYDALTEHLRLHDWEEVTWKNGLPKDKCLEEAIIDGILDVTWHIYAARAYYVDIFLPSHDINAFYEYLYHRVSATKIITLLITIIKIHSNEYKSATNEDYLIGKLNKYCQPLYEFKTNRKELVKSTEKEEGEPCQGCFAWHASYIGVFDPIGSEKSELTSTSDLIKYLIALRKQAVETLSTALKKNELLFRSVSTPDTVIAWSNQFLDSELNNMEKVKLNVDIALEKEECIKTEIDTLRSQFERLRFQAWLSKMDYESILNYYFIIYNKNHDYKNNIHITWEDCENINKLYESDIKSILHADKSKGNKRNINIFLKKTKKILDKNQETKGYEDKLRVILDNAKQANKLAINDNDILDIYLEKKYALYKYEEKNKFYDELKRVSAKLTNNSSKDIILKFQETIEFEEKLNISLEKKQNKKNLDDSEKAILNRHHQEDMYRDNYKEISNKYKKIKILLSIANDLKATFIKYNKDYENRFNVKPNLTEQNLIDAVKDNLKTVDLSLKELFEQVENSLSFARCLVERYDPQALEISDLIYTLLTEEIKNKDLQPWIKKQRRYALELKCRTRLIYWLYWEPLLDRKSSEERTTAHKTLEKKFFPPKEKEATSHKASEESPDANMTAANNDNIGATSDKTLEENSDVHEKDNNLFKRLQDAETYSIEYENLLRATTETNDDDANCRSTALTLRARTLYLRGHFQQAHHCLDLATTGFLPDRLENKIYISIVHIIRAELLAISAHEHYFSLGAFDEVAKVLNKHYLPFHKIKSEKIKLRELSENFQFPEHDKRLRPSPKPHTERKEFPKEIGGFAKIVLPIANSSLKKIERAEQELRQAETLLRDLNHHNIWLIYLEFGWAQIQIERLLYEIETLFLSWQPFSSATEYLQKCGHLEQKVFNVLRRIRNVMDAIPYQPKPWVNIKVEEGEKTRGLLIFRIEAGTYKLWRQLFVVGAYYSSLLNCLSHDTLKFNKNTAIFDVPEPYINSIISLAASSSKGEGNYLKQWKLWCSSMRFEVFSGDENMKSFELAQEVDKDLKALSLRAAVIKSMMTESSDEKIIKMWGIRRSKLEE